MGIQGRLNWYRASSRSRTLSGAERAQCGSDCEKAFTRKTAADDQGKPNQCRNVQRRRNQNHSTKAIKTTPRRADMA